MKLKTFPIKLPIVIFNNQRNTIIYNNTIKYKHLHKIRILEQEQHRL